MESIHITEITREQAETWLGHTSFNRAISNRAVNLLASDMSAGRWNHVVAPPIMIDEDHGGVIDGQHRLKAFLLTDLPVFQSYVLEVPRKSIEVIDTGRTRSLADTLQLRGHQYGRIKSAWLNRGVQWATGVPTSQGLTRTSQVAMVEAAPNVEMAAKVTEATRVSTSRRTVIHVPYGVTSNLWDMQQYGVGGDLVIEFVSRLQTSQGLDDVMSRLQKKLLDAKNPRTKLTISHDVISYLIARVFNAWINDEEILQLLGRRNAVANLPGYPEWAEANGFDLVKDVRTNSRVTNEPLGQDTPE